MSDLKMISERTHDLQLRDMEVTEAQRKALVCGEAVVTPVGDWFFVGVNAVHRLGEKIVLTTIWAKEKS